MTARWPASPSGLRLRAAVALPEGAVRLHVQPDGVFVTRRPEKGIEVWRLDRETLELVPLGHFARGHFRIQLLHVDAGAVTYLGEVYNEYGREIPARAIYQCGLRTPWRSDELFWVDYDLRPEARRGEEILLRHQTSTPDEYIDLELLAFSLRDRSVRPIEKAPADCEPWFRRLPSLAYASAAAESAPWEAGARQFFWRQLSAPGHSVRQLFVRTEGRELALTPDQPEGGRWWDLGVVVPEAGHLVFPRLPSPSPDGGGLGARVPMELWAVPLEEPDRPLVAQLPEQRGGSGLGRADDGLEFFEDLMLLREDSLFVVQVEGG